MSLSFARILERFISVKNVLLFLSLALFLVSATVAEAQSDGLRIKPAFFDKTIEPGELQKHSIAIENLSSTDQTYYLFTRNISDVKDGGVPVFAKYDDERTGYELADWIDLSVTEVSVRGGAAASFEYTLSVPENASPGSHFGAIFISVEP
ncbi:MAG: DUF916 domain-containing protein, partial [Candidatus Pacebacteria bacterium]|nr:DUF916 domain-containing protein [Candidatus Paceibacterota bacterium]